MGGAPLSEEVTRKISEVWYKQTSGGKKDVLGKELIQEAKKQLKMSKLTAPKADASYYNIFSSMKHLPPEKKRLIDKNNQPWNLNILDDSLYLPHDTLPFVMQLWRYAKNLGADLTIRQAKWSSRLCYILKDIDIAEQWIHMVRYSNEEEFSQISNTEMKLDRLNSQLFMGHWEIKTLVETDNKFKVNQRINHSFITFLSPGGIHEEFLHVFANVYESYFDAVFNGNVPENFDRIHELHYLISSLTPSSKFFPDIEMRMVYLRHLAKLSTLPYFKTADPKDIVKLITDLRNWIIEPQEEKLKSELDPDLKAMQEKFDEAYTTLDGTPIGAPEPVGVYEPVSKTTIKLANYGSFPLDIYLRAGFSLEEDAKEIESELRKIHPEYWEEKQ
jgi:hypothetical protein